jgi:hypothetical protein
MAAAALLAAGLQAQTMTVQNDSMGVLQTSSGNGVGFPSKVLLAWPRSEVHKHFGIPSRFLVQSAPADEYAETDRVEWSFRTRLPIADMYAEMPGLGRYPMWIYYDIDPTAAKLGVRQRVRSVRVELPQPVSLWDLMDSAPATLPEAADLCGGACALYKLRSGEEEYVLAAPRAPSADQREIGRWVGAGYAAKSGEEWTPAMRLRLARGSWMVTEVRIEAVRAGEEAGRAVERLGTWTTK